jgi:hypothetical protein
MKLTVKKVIHNLCDILPVEIYACNSQLSLYFLNYLINIVSQLSVH